MKSANNYVASRRTLVTDSAHPLFNDTVNFNDAFAVATALAFIAESAMPNDVTLVNTISAGYNTYMTLQIPADKIHDFDFTVFPLDFDDASSVMLADDLILVCADFPDIAANLANPLSADDFE